MSNEDFDIKIFTPMKTAKESEPVVIADEMKKQVVSGNLQKAKQLGKLIAVSFREAAAKEELWNLARECCIDDLSRSVKDQAIILSVFTAEYSLNNFMPDPILSTSALTTLYDTLTEDSPELYSNLLASTAFSFYYMELDGKTADPDVIGRTFAMLCGDKPSKSLACYGRTVFEQSLKQYKAAVEEVNFA